MKHLIFAIALFSFGINSNIQAQDSVTSNNTDRQLIEETIEMYFEGWLTGDTLKLGKAMHATCKLKNIKEKKVAVYDRATYLGFFNPRPRLENAGGKILNIDITGPIASAKCSLETSTTLYTDYFNMIRLEGRWYIVDKISTKEKK